MYTPRFIVFVNFSNQNGVEEWKLQESAQFSQFLNGPSPTNDVILHHVGVEVCREVGRNRKYIQNTVHKLETICALVTTKMYWNHIHSCCLWCWRYGNHEGEADTLSSTQDLGKSKIIVKLLLFTTDLGSRWMCYMRTTEQLLHCCIL